MWCTAVSLAMMSYLLLVSVLISAGFLNVFICMHALQLSQYTSTFGHGVITALFMLENWILCKDLKSAENTELSQRLEESKVTIEGLRQYYFKLDTANRRMEAQIQELAAEHKRRTCGRSKSWHDEAIS